uniref:Uncharacterized protein n=1 Tax=Micrurus spixii TaxID=129469 RepID=A0A2D4LBI3_9SAUR
MYENIIKPIYIWDPRDRTDPKNKVDMSFGAHSESHKIQAHKNTAQMHYVTIFTTFGIFFPLPSTWLQLSLALQTCEGHKREDLSQNSFTRRIIYLYRDNIIYYLSVQRIENSLS